MDLAITNGSATFNHDYDTAGRLTQVTRPDGKVVLASVDAAGNRTSLTYPGVPTYVVNYSQEEIQVSEQLKADFNYSDPLIPCVVRNDLGPASVAQTAAVEQYYAQYAFQDGVKVNANGLDVREIGGSKYGAIVVGEVRNGDGSTTLTNITQPTHFLYNGSGERTITTSNDRTIITSVGTGSNSSGIIAAANQILGPIIFNEVDRTLRNRIHGP